MPSGTEARLALGTVQFGLNYGIANRNGQVTRPEAKSMLQLAEASRIDVLDTAVGYGDSEACLGEIGIKGFNIVTKLPAVPDECPDVEAWVREQVSRSLERLRVPSLYGLLLHRPHQLLEPVGRALYAALTETRAAGHVKRIGISIYGPDELDALSERYDFNLVQAPFSLVDRRMASSGWLARLSDQGVEVHTRSAFLQGLLLMERTNVPAGFERWSEIWNRWHEWLSHHKRPALETALAFPLSFPEVSRVVVGADGLEQLRQIVAAATTELVEFPDLACDAEELVNPSRWSSSH